MDKVEIITEELKKIGVKYLGLTMPIRTAILKAMVRHNFISGGIVSTKKFKYPIRFFYFDKMVGEFECPEQTDEKIRRKMAVDNGIDKWTHFILGDNKAMGIKLEESKHDLRGEKGEYSTADYLPLPSGDYLVWIDPDCETSTIKIDLS